MQHVAVLPHDKCALIESLNGFLSAVLAHIAVVAMLSSVAATASAAAAAVTAALNLMLTI